MTKLNIKLLTNPKTNLKSLKKLQKIYKNHNNPITHLTLLSSTTIFKNILPK